MLENELMRSEAKQWAEKIIRIGPPAYGTLLACQKWEEQQGNKTFCVYIGSYCVYTWFGLEEEANEWLEVHRSAIASIILTAWASLSPKKKTEGSDARKTRSDELPQA